MITITEKQMIVYDTLVQAIGEKGCLVASGFRPDGVSERTTRTALLRLRRAGVIKAEVIDNRTRRFTILCPRSDLRVVTMAEIGRANGWRSGRSPATMLMARLDDGEFMKAAIARKLPRFEDVRLKSYGGIYRPQRPEARVL